MRNILMAATAAVLLAGNANAAIVSGTLNGFVDFVVPGETTVTVGTPVVTTFSFDDATPLSGDIFEATSFSIVIGGTSIGADKRGATYPQITYTSGVVTDVSFLGDAPAAAFGLLNDTFEVTVTGLTFEVGDALGNSAFSGLLTPVPAALPLLASAVGALAIAARRRRG